MRRTGFVGFIAVLGSILAIPPASATFPGSNGKIAFTVVSDKSGSQIAVIEADGSGRTLLTTTTKPTYEGPSWSADGSKIAFGSIGAGSNALPKLRTMNADGTGKTTVITLPSRYGRVLATSWSPDSTKIAFCAETNTGEHVYSVGADGTGLDRLTPKSGFDCDPDWSPDGTTIAFGSLVTGTGLVVATMDTDGSNTQFLRTGWYPAWSPDGGKLVFATVRNGLDIYTMNANGTGVIRITDTPKRRESHPAFSPDGTAIAFARKTGPHLRDPNDIWTVIVAGGVFTRVTDTPSRDEAWAGLSWQAT